MATTIPPIMVGTPRRMSRRRAKYVAQTLYEWYCESLRDADKADADLLDDEDYYRGRMEGLQAALIMLGVELEDDPTARRPLGRIANVPVLEGVQDRYEPEVAGETEPTPSDAVHDAVGTDRR